MTARLQVAAILFSALCLAGGWYVAGQVFTACGLMGLGALWLFAEARRWPLASPLALIGVMLLAAWGDFMHLNSLLMLGAVLFGLAAWDLSDFLRRLRQAAPGDDLPGLERRHFTRLGVVLILGFTLSALAQSISNLRFNFDIALVLVLVGVWGLAHLFTLMLDRER